VNGGALGKVGVARHNGKVAVDDRAFTEIQIAANDRRISGNGVPRFDSYRSEGNSDVTRHITVQVNGAECAGDIAYGLAFGNSDIRAEAGAVVTAM
jgi:hypothetical protein